MRYEKALHDLLAEKGITDISDFGRRPAYFERHWVPGLDHMIIFDEIEDACDGNTLDGFGGLYDQLHVMADEINSIPGFIEELKQVISESSDLFDVLYEGLTYWYESITEELDDIQYI